MKKRLLFIFIIFYVFHATAQNDWQANWITDASSKNEVNSWYSFRKDFSLKKVPQEALTQIAIDSKYWLWINGELVVFEGGLKRGPTPKDTYYDEINISKYLKKGENNISVLGWFFGKEGFSHKNSGQFGFLFQCISPGINIISDSSWKVTQNTAYESCPEPLPNFRLPESSIRYNAQKDIGNWQNPNYNTSHWKPAKIIGKPPMAPWNNLVLRPIPQWKDSKLKPYIKAPQFPIQFDRDTTIICTLPSNIQITPYLKIETQDTGKLIEIKTENFMGGGSPNVYAQYISNKGIQEYESYGWMNGQTVEYKISEGVKVLDLKYRETGYDTEFAGSFSSSDPFLNKIWKKSLRTLYVTMRDTYMDCPDRERAQWWGDAVNEGGEAFYALDTNSHALLKKGMYELINWQRADSTLFSPVPAGNWSKELPVQMLASVGYYGFWNYYLNTGDKQSMQDLYQGVRKYLKIWQTHDDGSIVFRKGDWSWGDWGRNKDMKLITNGFYYLALKGALNMAKSLNKTEDIAEYNAAMARIKKVYNTKYWTGKAYRHPLYKGKTDDRSQALAIVAGIADPEKYLTLLETFKTEEHASPYMEKYVLEALFQMGYVDYGITRMKKRFGDMVNHPDYTTLFEGWGIGEEGFGGGTTNHAWSGGALTILSQYLCGIEPVKPGYTVFQIIPNPGSVKSASAEIQSVKGIIKSNYENSEKLFTLNVSIPKGTEAIVGIPSSNTQLIKINNNTIWNRGKHIKNKHVLKYLGAVDNHILFRINEGDYTLKASK